MSNLKKKPRRAEKRYAKLQAAVVNLYTAAMWLPDRYVENEADLWEKLRDAAGIREGTKTELFWEAVEARRRQDEEGER